MSLTNSTITSPIGLWTSGKRGLHYDITQGLMQNMPRVLLWTCVEIDLELVLWCQHELQAITLFCLPTSTQYTTCSHVAVCGLTCEQGWWHYTGLCGRVDLPTLVFPDPKVELRLWPLSYAPLVAIGANRHLIQVEVLKCECVCVGGCMCVCVCVGGCVLTSRLFRGGPASDTVTTRTPPYAYKHT